MFSYPSGANLHVGHWYNFGLGDSYARFKRMQGFELFHPMGFDAFGLPAENYAIKTGVHPQDSTFANIKTMDAQLRDMGATYDWDFELATCMPDYYKWTQWLFLKLFERGLAYRDQAPVNWCPRCKTVLANEQVVDGACERCDTEVTKRNLTQWFFKITDYAEELLDCLPGLDWPEKTKKMQQNWIGRSYGAEITFVVAGADGADGADNAGSADDAGGADNAGGLSFKVFTTRADTLFGVTYAVIAPEHPLVDAIVTPSCRQAVEAYREEAKKRSEIDRMSTAREKTGVPTGAYAINPATGERVPIWVADYVLASYGTGCVMAVPGHDVRDYEFAEEFGLPIKRVIKGASEGVDDALPFVEDGVMVDSGAFTGLTSEEGRNGVVAHLETSGLASQHVNYRLRDWLVSRQRYWGAPIPVVHCPACGIAPIPENELPVLLPYDVEFTPDGVSPLKKCAEFMETTCPKCGGPAERDPDTLDTFVCSSWYYLRYLDNRNDDKPFDTAWANRMMPVDVYIGGAEHATMHLLYARFICKALRDMGYLEAGEPFTRLVHQGMVLGADGMKMSKSLGNTVSPDDYIEKYGSDVFRMFLGFGYAFADGGPWSDDGIRAVARFIARVEREADSLLGLFSRRGATFADAAKDAAAGAGAAAGALAAAGAGAAAAAAADAGAAVRPYKEAEAELEYVRNHSIKSASADIERFQFNTAIARAMELLNALVKYEADVPEASRDLSLAAQAFADLVRLIAPFAPHFAEEMWERVGLQYSVFARGNWPKHDEAALVRAIVEMAVQVNGAVRFKINVPKDASDAQIEELARGDGRLGTFLGGDPIKKVVVVRGRLVNIVK